MAHNQKGEEILDPTPISLPVGFKRPQSLNDKIRQMVQNEASRLAEAQGYETFEEADDFNIPDDPPDPLTPWEENFDPEAPFIAEKETAIRHGVVQDMDESKIHEGKKELEKFQKKAQKQNAAKKTSPQEMPAAEGEEQTD